MHIRSKLFYSFLLVAILPFVFGGLLSFNILKKAVVKGKADQLNSIASIQESRVNAVLDQYLWLVRLIQSSHELTESLDAYNISENQDSTTIKTTITGLSSLIQDVKEITIISKEGRVIDSTIDNLKGDLVFTLI